MSAQLELKPSFRPIDVPQYCCNGSLWKAWVSQCWRGMHRCTIGILQEASGVGDVRTLLKRRTGLEFELSTAALYVSYT